MSLNDTLDQMHITDVYGKFQLKTFFSSAHGIFSRIGHMLVHQASFNKLKKTEFVSFIFSNHMV